VDCFLAYACWLLWWYMYL